MSIYTLINEIEQGSLVLPAIQRDFVWDEKKIEVLLDSIFRGYPVGIALLWDTYQPIQIRNFEKRHEPGLIYQFSENKPGNRLRLVLDGQQRLSSLFVALRGTFDGRKLYFDVLSGHESDNHADVKYKFSFADDADVKARNSEWEAARSSKTEKKGTLEYWILLRDLIGKNPRETFGLANEITGRLALEEEEKLLLDMNIKTSIYSLTNDDEILKTQTIDANLPPDDQNRKTSFDILEIFVRINTQGMPLRRSDLIISMLRLYWQESSNLLPSFVKEINEGNNFELDNDFVIRCMFATAGIGTRLDFDLLRKKSNVDAVQATYKKCFDAIRVCVDFVRNDCGIESAKLIGGASTMVPFVYFFFRFGASEFDVMSRDRAKKSLLLFAFSKVFTQHVDSRTGSFIRDYLAPPKQMERFPLDSAVKYVNWYTSIENADTYLFSGNVELALSLLQNRSGAKAKHYTSQPEVDHIFPKSELRENFEISEINRLGNYWILPLNINRNKSAKHPHKFFEEVDQRALNDALIDKSKLDYRSFRSFVRDREARMSDKLVKLTGLSLDVFAAALESGE